MRASAHCLFGAALTLAVIIDGNAGAVWATATQQESLPLRNKQTIADAFDRWAAGGGQFFNEVLAPDAVWTIEGSGPSAGEFRGRDLFLQRAVRPFAGRMSVPVRPIAKRLWAEGNHVIVNWEGEGVARDGAPYRNSYAWIFRMKDGKAVEVTAFLDLAPYDDVLRRIPAPAPEGAPQ